MAELNQTFWISDDVSDLVCKKRHHLKEIRFVERIFQKDFHLWADNPAEISNRLGWLDVADRMLKSVDEIESWAAIARNRYTDATLIGMGGSSLAPEVFFKVFFCSDNSLRLHILDSTDPQAIAQTCSRLDPDKTLHIVSTKSGSTIETLSIFQYLYYEQYQKIGDLAGDHFVAITDPGSQLETTARELRFSKCFLNDPNIGGRFSALSFFGLVPAAFLNINLKGLLKKAVIMRQRCLSEEMTVNNRLTGLGLGVLLASFAASGRDKIILLSPPRYVCLGDWIEQLIAESTGKKGLGILPVVHETLDDQSGNESDRTYIYFKTDSGAPLPDHLHRLIDRNRPVVCLNIDEPFDVASQMYLWEFATATAGCLMNLNPFDQPNVESSKKLSKQFMDSYKASGTFSSDRPDLTISNIDLFSSVKTTNPNETIMAFLKTVQPDGYIALQSYSNPSFENYTEMKKLAESLHEKLGVTVTISFGPRYLHSTGQLHKGDSGKGVFIQLLSSAPNDIPIPDTPKSHHSTVSFEILKQAQAFGDKEAIRQAGRPILQLIFPSASFSNACLLLQKSLTAF